MNAATCGASDQFEPLIDLPCEAHDIQSMADPLTLSMASLTKLGAEAARQADEEARTQQIWPAGLIAPEKVARKKPTVKIKRVIRVVKHKRSTKSASKLVRKAFRTRPSSSPKAAQK